ncbi:MAG TPA: hypothetical protein VMX79_01770 [bacterium]|nr:hypothetical protein [bacterium]
MKVFVDGKELRVRAGAPVESALSEGQRRAAAEGAIYVVDAWGQRVGLKGTPADGAAYFTVTVGARPPSVNACLEAWEGLPGAPALPAELVKFLVKRAITTLTKAGGAASVEGTAAFAASIASRQDAAAMWAYVAGDDASVAVCAGGKARVRDVAPNVATAVVATRDILTFRSGATFFDYLDGVSVAEVGTTNKVKLADYEDKFAGVDAVVACRAGDFAMEGFVASPEAEELAAAAAAAGVTFVNISADDALFDERGAPRRLAGDVVVFATPREARPYDLVFVKVPGSVGSAGDAALYEEAAAALWRFLTEE